MIKKSSDKRGRLTRMARFGYVNDSSPGEWRVIYRPSRPGYSSTGCGAYAGWIYMPTPYGSIIPRIHVDNSTDATNVAEGIQTNLL
jgi:hypothetical protein